MRNRGTIADLWHACGGDGELRLLIERPAQNTRGFGLAHPFAVIGRDESCDISVDDEELSRRHLYLQLLRGRIWCFDLVSRTGTWWGEQRLESGWLPADGVRVGPVQIQALDHATVGGEGNPTAPSSDDAALPTLRVEFLNAASTSDRATPVAWQLDRVMTFIGQSHLCKIRFRCPSVSRIHCSLLRTPGGVWVIDLLGRERIQVNGMQVRWARLQEGDILKVGRFEMLMRAIGDTSPTQSGDAAGSTESHTDIISNLGAMANVAGAGALVASTRAGLPAPLTPAALGITNSGGALDSTQVLLAFMNQFSNMQHQMFEQFQQTTLMMMQMFGSLQREQLELVRQELDGLREVNVQVQTLQAEIARFRSAGGNASEFSDKPKTQAQAQPAALRNGNAPAFPAPPMPAPAPVAPSPAAAPGPASTTPSNVTPAPASPAGLEGTEDPHSWLCQRFAELEKERQSRWQRVFGVLLGK